MKNPIDNQSTLQARRIQPLDGDWELADSLDTQPPPQFPSRAPVPGLVDQAEPPFADAGLPCEQRRYFWYRRRFTCAAGEGTHSLLKIHKAMYGSAVWLNGTHLGEHLPSFTPSYWPLEDALVDGENEVLIRIGHHYTILPEGMPNGEDFERIRYYPGIYDSVEIEQWQGPRIANLQCIPDLPGSRVTLQIELEAQADDASADLDIRVLTDSEERVAAETRAAVETPAGTTRHDITLELPDAQLWWPEQPFLYRVEVRTAGDSLVQRFGMRSFRFDAQSKMAVLNDEPRYLRGTNICIQRFFEDDSRGNKPWDPDWVRRLHRAYKAMGWDCVRYCIGFPPDFWYDIADEEGVLLSDEFPIWTLSTLNEHPERLRTERLIPEYTDWMRERWNHPSVVIWDGQNESETEVTAEAQEAVRHLDRSDRPWDSGWATPRHSTDCVESHPYLFNRNYEEPDGPFFTLGEMAGVEKTPWLTPQQRKVDTPIIINEYDWLWVNRAGEPCGLTQHYYRVMLGADADADAHFRHHARGVAALTEFWRSHRRAAGVYHFCGLGYSRQVEPGREKHSATSDDFIDIDELRFEPHFERYVRDAFHPVGIMLDFWAEKLMSARRQDFTVAVINDRHTPWSGTVTMRLEQDGTTHPLGSAELAVGPLGRSEAHLEVSIPELLGPATLLATITDDGQPISSLRDVRLV